MIRFAIALVAAVTLTTAACGSSGPATEVAGDAIPHMSWDEVASAMSAGAVLVDARGEDSFAKGHIAGAINVPYKDTDAYTSLPDKRDTKLVFYCGGPACSASLKGAVAAKNMGFTDVAEYKGGYPEWAKANGM